MVELGISTFGETTELEGTGQTYSHAERIRQLVAEIELADKVGLDVYGIGEHHRADFAVSAPEIVLAAGAVNTKKIRLTSAVSILSSMDPIRLFQQYATIDALSNGRAEIMAGRGSFTESFPLFGYDLKDYEALFDEKLDLLQLVNEKIKLDWQGRLTQTISGKEVYPRPVQDKLPLWIATGGHVESTAGQSAPALDWSNWNILSVTSPISIFRQAETLAVHIWKVNSEGTIPDGTIVSAGSAAVLLIFILIFNFGARKLGSYLHKKLTAA